LKTCGNCPARMMLESLPSALPTKMSDDLVQADGVPRDQDHVGAVSVAGGPRAGRYRSWSARDVMCEFVEPGAGGGVARCAPSQCGDSDPPEPTLGALGSVDLLNWLVCTNRCRNTASHALIAGRSYSWRWLSGTGSGHRPSLRSPHAWWAR